MRNLLWLAAPLFVIGGCSRHTRHQADATANSAAADIRAAGRQADRDTAGVRQSLRATGHDLAKAADHVESETKTLVAKANHEMAKDR